MSERTAPREPLAWVGPATALGLAVALALLLLPTGLSAVDDGEVGPGWRWGLVAALVGLHSALLPPLSTRHPVVALALGAAAMLVLVAAPDLAGEMAQQAGAAVAPVLLPSGLVWFVLLHNVSARSRDPWPSVALGAGLVGALLTVARLWDATSFAGGLAGPWGWRIFLVAAVLGGTLAAWALGRYRATRTAWVEAVADRAAAEERRRIAREMHDVVAHSLAVVVAQAEGGRMLVDRDPARAAAVLDTVAGTGREALAQMRTLVGVLRDEEGDEEGEQGDDDAREYDGPGRAAVPQPGLGDLAALLERVREAGLPVTQETVGTPRELGEAAGLTAYRIVQESLTNVVRHAGPGAEALVVLDWTDGLTVTVADRGGAGTPGRGPHGVGRGLVGMRERVAAVGGELEAGPSEGGGWRTRARIPS